MSEDSRESREWRHGTSYFVTIGRCLEIIERELRSVQAINVVNNSECEAALYSMRSAANKLSAEINMLLHISRNPKA
jgi:hypothetical protein